MWQLHRQPDKKGSEKEEENVANKIRIHQLDCQLMSVFLSMITKKDLLLITFPEEAIPLTMQR